MSTHFSLPYRQIHLDFHTGELIPDVGRDFDPAEFVHTFQAAHVNSVTVFAKCHHGHLYYATSRPERHPNLKPGLDLLSQQVQALHSAGIRAPIYISVQVDEYTANKHPEWVARNPDTSCVKWNQHVFAPGWQILDMSSPYQDYLAEQTAEILQRFEPVDGIFFDMCWDQPSVSQWAIAGMAQQGLDPENETDRQRYAHQTALAYMARFYHLVKASSPDASVYFNSRPLSGLAEEIDYLEQVEIEALPTGGWGYQYFPTHVRYARTFGKPYLGMTARFHKTWADFGGLKPYAALEYETSQMMAHGARCSIGDQMHPRGVLDPAAYQLIGQAYRRVAEREPWLEGAEPVTQIGLFRLTGGAQTPLQSSAAAVEGVTRCLTQLKQQFDVVTTASRFEAYDLLILPDEIAGGMGLDEALIARLRAYLTQGGALLATGSSGLSADGKTLLLPELGFHPQGWSPFTTTYFRFEAAISADVPTTDHVMYERGLRVLPGENVQRLAQVVEPYFERAWNHFSSHNQTPPAEATPFAAATLCGRAAYISYPIFSAFAKHGNIPYRLLVQNILELLLPEPLLRVGGPTGLEATVTRQKTAHTARTIVHLLFYTPERRTHNLDIVEDIIPLYDVPVSLKMDIPPQQVYLAPDRQAVDFEYHPSEKRVIAVAPQVNGHAMLVFE